MNRTLWIASVLLLVCHARAADLDRLSVNRECGAYAAGLVLQILNYPLPTFDQLRRDVGIDPGGVTSLWAIGNGLERNGVEVRRIAVSSEPPELCVLRMRPGTVKSASGGHFVVVRAVSTQEVIVFSPPEEVVRLPWAEIVKLIDRDALECRAPAQGVKWVASAAALAAALAIAIWACYCRTLRRDALLLTLWLASGCDSGAQRTGGVAVQPSTFFDLGEVPAGYAIQRFALLNSSDYPIRVTRYRASCSCAGVDVDLSRPIAPGERRECTARLSVPFGRVQNVAITVEFDRNAPVTIHMVMRGASPLGTEAQPELELGSLPVGIRHDAEVAFVVNPQRTSLLMHGQSAPHVSWRAEKYGNATIRSHGSNVTESGTIRVWAKVEFTPLLTGPDDLEVIAETGAITATFIVRWTGCDSSQAGDDTQSPQPTVERTLSELLDRLAAARAKRASYAYRERERELRFGSETKRAEYDWAIDGNAVRHSWTRRRVVGGTDAGREMLEVNHGDRFYLAVRHDDEWEAIVKPSRDGIIGRRSVLTCHTYPLPGVSVERLCVSHPIVEIVLTPTECVCVLALNSAVRDALARGWPVWGFLGWRLHFQKHGGDLHLVRMDELATTTLRTASGIEENPRLLGDEVSNVCGVECAPTHTHTWSNWFDLGPYLIPLSYSLRFRGVTRESEIERSSIRSLSPEECETVFAFKPPADWFPRKGIEYDLVTGDRVVLGHANSVARHSIERAAMRGEELAARLTVDVRTVLPLAGATLLLAGGGVLLWRGRGRPLQ